MSNSEVQAIPNVWDSVLRRRAGARARAEVAGQQRHRVADADDLAEQGLSQCAVVIELVASAEPVTATAARRDTVTGATTTVLESRSARRSTTSRRRGVRPVGVPDGAIPATAAVSREPIRAIPSHSRRPSAVSASGCRRTTPRRVSAAEVLSRTVSASSGEVTLSSLRAGATCDSRLPADRSASSPAGPSDVGVQASACAATTATLGGCPTFGGFSIPDFRAGSDPALGPDREGNVQEVAADERSAGCTGT